MKSLVVIGMMVSGVLLIPSVAYAQQDSQDKPLGDVAREQRELRKQREKDRPPIVVHSDDEVPAAPDAAETKPSRSPEDSASKSNPSGKQEKSTPSEHSRSVFDRPKESVPDTIIVPAGTELRVDIHNHKVVLPVRVGFATPIPALSRVTVQVIRTYVNTAYSLNGMPYVDYVEYATVTAVTVGATTYDVETDTVPLLQGGTNSELIFILGKPVAVLR